MTPLQTSIVDALKRLKGSGTTRRIQGEMGNAPNPTGILRIPSTCSIATSLCYLRGDKVVTDGSMAEVFPDGIAHTPAKSPITWTLIPERGET